MHQFRINRPTIGVVCAARGILNRQFDSTNPHRCCNWSLSEIEILEQAVQHVLLCVETLPLDAVSDATHRKTKIPTIDNDLRSEIKGETMSFLRPFVRRDNGCCRGR